MIVERRKQGSLMVIFPLRYTWKFTYVMATVRQSGPRGKLGRDFCDSRSFWGEEGTGRWSRTYVFAFSFSWREGLERIRHSCLKCNNLVCYAFLASLIIQFDGYNDDRAYFGTLIKTVNKILLLLITSPKNSGEIFLFLFFFSEEKIYLLKVTIETWIRVWFEIACVAKWKRHDGNI